jgi:hypothetical protein
MLAAQTGDTNILQTLIKHGAQLNDTDYQVLQLLFCN